MPVHRDRDDLYIADDKDWQAARREHRSIVVAWIAVFLLGIIFWAVVVCAVLG
jgi:hypothetical protein